MNYSKFKNILFGVVLSVLVVAGKPGYTANAKSESNATEVSTSQSNFQITESKSAKHNERVKEYQDALDVLRLAAAGNEKKTEEWLSVSSEMKARAAATALDSGALDVRNWSFTELKKFKSPNGSWEQPKIVIPALAKAWVKEPDKKLRGEAFNQWLETAKYGQSFKANEKKEDEKANLKKDPQVGGDKKESNEKKDRKLNPEALNQADLAVDAMAGMLGKGKLLEQNRVAEGLMAADTPKVLDVFVDHFIEIWGRAPRSHVLFARQRAYIADYDVAGAVFDPVIRSFLVGVVLDVEQLGVEIHHFIYHRMNQLLGRDPGHDPAKWRIQMDDWKEKQKK